MMKLYIDITDLARWRGNFTGIQRVVYSVTNQILKIDKSIQPVFFNGNYYEHIDFRDAMERRVSSVPNVPLNTNRRESVKRTVQMFAPPAAYVLKNRITHRLKQLNVTKRRTGTAKTINNDTYKCSFEGGDILLVLGIYPGDTAHMQNRKRLHDKKVEIWQVVFDLVPALKPQFQSGEFHRHFEEFMLQTMAYSDEFLAISEHTKTDMLRFAKRNNIKLASSKVHVFRLGDDISELHVEGKNDDGDDYILSVSTIEVRKNYSLLYYAYRYLVDHGKEPPKLIIAGKAGWLAGDTIHMLENDPEVSKYVEIRHGLTDQELAGLYRNCQFTVYPSFYEGWGLPVAEALAYGKFCIASNSSSIPEVGGDLVEYFDPTDPVVLANHIYSYSHNKSLLARKENTIRNNYQQTTWRQTAEQVLSYISTVRS